MSELSELMGSSPEEMFFIFILLAILAVGILVRVPELMLGALLIAAVLPFVMPMTLEIKETRLPNGCKHVVITTLGGLIKHLDTETCGDIEVVIGGKKVTVDAEK